MDLEKTYNPNNIESKWYEYWQNNQVFAPNEKKDTYTIMIPPPNVTGILHLGHVLNNTIQDLLIRKAKMEGKNTLWLPGTDHASIATEAKVTKMLKEKNIDKRQIGREEFLKHSWKWTDKYGGIIINQLKRLGCSCYWPYERFTMDDKYYKSVIQTFVKLYNKGLIYKGVRMVNWDPEGLTALSDEEVKYKEESGKLWHIKYQIKDSNDYLVVATTRPETMLGDTGVAVNPKDKRYSKHIGKTVILPIVNKEIPIFSDDYVDMQFGTGCVKVTPAHDPNDLEMANRHKLEIVNIMNDDGTMNKNVPAEFQKLDRFKAREKVVAELNAIEQIDKIEDYIHKVGYSERTDVVVEPRLSEQWFLKMKDLAKPALDVVNDGKIKFYPDRWTKIYNHWLNNITDWCISRQLWWGHRIPVWYKDDEIYCGENAPKGEGWIQDEDVLDTWFSSWIWPMATLGWPKETQDLNRFYPTQVLVTGPDIIFFWVARMIMSSLYFKQEIPFSTVYFTSIIRDSKGMKMSKSLGNSPDALELFDEYGVDAVRMTILMIAPQGTDVLFSVDKIEQGRNFMNKLWNCSRFLLMNTDKNEIISFEELDEKYIESIDKWIISKLNTTISDVNKYLDDYKLNEAIKCIYNFTWKDYCDWYLEFAKNRIYGLDENEKKTVISIMVYVLKNILQLLHPYAPFITEEIWSYLNQENENNIIINSKWPISNKKMINKKINLEMSFVMSVISAIRNLKSELNISPKKEITLVCRGSKNKTMIIKENQKYFDNLVKVTSLNCYEEIEKPEQSSTLVINDVEFFIPLSNLINLDKEIIRLEDKIKEYAGRIKSVERKINNKNFIKRAPSDIVEHEQKKYSQYKNDYNKLKNNLKNLKS